MKIPRFVVLTHALLGFAVVPDPDPGHDATQHRAGDTHAHIER
jgi:hypothetical protein